MSYDTPVCIDVSHHQGEINWPEVRAAGVLGMIHKATEGQTFVDDMFRKNCSEAKKAGLATSTYYWLKPGDGRAQTEFYLANLDPVKGERVCIDYEENGCSLTTLKDAVQTLLDYNKGLQICVYSGHLIKEVLNGRDDFLAEHTCLWLAEYQSENTIDDISWESATWPQWSLHQYSESGSIDGINDAYVDLNRFNGSNENFLKWINPAGSPVPEPPEPVPGTVINITITTEPKDANVQVTVNGNSLIKHRLGRMLRKVKRGPDITR